MHVNRRTVILIAVVVAVIAGVYAITWWQRARETRRLLDDLRMADHGAATKAMTGLRDRAASIRGELLEMLRRGDDHVRWRAAVLLSEADGPAVREALVAALADPAADVRLNAALSLGRLNAKNAAGAIAKLAGDKDEEVMVRAGAVRALRMLRAYQYLDDVRELVADRPEPPPEPAEQDEAAAAEDTATDEEAAAEEAPADPTAPVRLAAVRALPVLAAAAWVHKGGTAAASEDAAGAQAPVDPALAAAQLLIESTRAENEPNADVRQAACYALGDLAALVPDPTVDERVARALAGALEEDEISDVRIAAAHVLAVMDAPKEAIPVITRALEDVARFDDHYWVRQAALEAINGG